ncbi:lytic transglycosylase domain-containing protein [Megasphaera vaginalis (ex Bordigoni et al. 2020)]|uniref:lytic transglycosylase domain-containing protein n=1 Tax=Megasphaera vaginalis (ex Bordigoni et al. 2020) TaxID=2045301 RepID=UPI001F18679F|nr:lytic transglycosylase domain-containing protein [Megasphaera vaginalis (ex Bordigoni et al. 2020)]
MKRSRYHKGNLITAIILVVLSGTYFVSWRHVLVQKYVFPMDYGVTLQTYAREDQVDPALVAAVILAESKFNQGASSHRGASGLMQIMPETGAWIAEQMGIQHFTPEMLKDVEQNLKMGTWYLSYLLREYDGNQILALAAYNAGRGHVDEWMQEYGWDKSFSKIKEIPFSETREYVKVVLQNQEEYRKLYEF